MSRNNDAEIVGMVKNFSGLSCQFDIIRPITDKIVNCYVAKEFK